MGARAAATAGRPGIGSPEHSSGFVGGTISEGGLTMKSKRPKICLIAHIFMIAKAVPELVAIQLADLFATLSDASRVRIISALLDEELSVGVLAEKLGMSESAVSHQLRGLRQMHLVRARRQGRRMFYRLDDDHVRELLLMGVDHVEHG